MLRQDHAVRGETVEAAGPALRKLDRAAAAVYRREARLRSLIVALREIGGRNSEMNSGAFAAAYAVETPLNAIRRQTAQGVEIALGRSLIELQFRPPRFAVGRGVGCQETKGGNFAANPLHKQQNEVAGHQGREVHRLQIPCRSRFSGGGRTNGEGDGAGCNCAAKPASGSRQRRAETDAGWQCIAGERWTAAPGRRTLSRRGHRSYSRASQTGGRHAREQRHL